MDAAGFTLDGAPLEYLPLPTGTARMDLWVELSREGLAIVREEFGKKVLARCEHSFELGQKYEFTVECRGEQVTVFENGRELLTAQVGLNRGAVGYGVEQGARMLIEKFSVQPL